MKLYAHFFLEVKFFSLKNSVSSKVIPKTKFDPEEKVSFGIKIPINLRRMSENAKKI